MLRVVLTGLLFAASCGAHGAGEGTAAWVRGDTLRTIVREFLATRFAESGEEGEITFRSVPDRIPVAHLPYSVRVSSGGSGRIRGALTLVVEIEDGKRSVQRCMVTAMVRTYADVLVAARSLQRHATPTADDVVRLRMETTLMDRPLAAEDEILASQRTKRIVPQGAVLYADQFEQVPLVFQGDTVRVKVRSGGVIVTAEGIAREDGSYGDVIQVHLQGRSERVKARVLDAHTLTVQLD